MVTIIVNHEVKKFEDWKKVFDADGENRSKSDMKITGVFQSVENPNHVTLTAESPSVESAKKFFANPDLGQAMEMGGVINKPEIKILKKV